LFVLTKKNAIIDDVLAHSERHESCSPTRWRVFSYCYVIYNSDAVMSPVVTRFRRDAVVTYKPRVIRPLLHGLSTCRKNLKSTKWRYSSYETKLCIEVKRATPEYDHDTAVRSLNVTTPRADSVVTPDQSLNNILHIHRCTHFQNPLTFSLNPDAMILSLLLPLLSLVVFPSARPAVESLGSTALNSSLNVFIRAPEACS
jgi:hypothetical protein